MTDKDQFKKLQNGVKLLLTKNGYKFSEEDRALLEEILVQLEEISSKDDEDTSQHQILDLLSLLLRFLKFFGIDDISGLF